MKIKHIINTVLLFSAVSLHAQNACRLRIAGNLLNALDSTRIKKAEVFIEKWHVKTSVDEDGHFELRGICPGELLLEIDADSFGHFHFTFDLRQDSQVFIYLYPGEKQLDKIQVSGSVEKGPNQVNNRGITESAGTNLAAQLEKIPGVQSLKTGNNIAKPIVQGMTGMRVPMFVNGVKQYGQQWGNEHGPEADALGYEMLELITGANTLTKSADALGGMIEMRSDKNPHPGEMDILFGTGFQMNGRQFHAFAKFLHNPIKKSLYYFTNVSMRRSGNYQAPNYYLDNTALSELAWTGGLKHTGKDRITYLDGSFYSLNSGIFSGSHIGNISDLEKKIHNPSNPPGSFSYAISTPRQTATHAQLRYRRIREKNTAKNNLILALQWNQRREFDFHRLSSQTFPQLDISLATGFVQVSRELRTKTNFRFDFGSQTTGYLNRYGGFYFIPDYEGINQAFYFLAEKKFAHFKHLFSIRSETSYLHAQANANLVHIDDTRFFSNVAAAWTGELVKGANIIKFDVARLFRTPWVNELYSYGVHHGAAAFEQGNIHLKTETDYKTGITYQRTTKKGSHFVHIFNNFIPDFINLTPDTSPVLTVRGAFPSYHYEQFNCLFSGIDVLSEIEITDAFLLQLSAGYVKAVNLDTKKYPAYIPPLKAGIALKYESRWFVAKVKADFTARQWLYTNGSDLLPPPPSYTLINMELRTKSIFRKQNWDITFGANNLLNTSYRNYLDRFRYFADMPGRNIYLKLLWNFHHHKE